jgi:hypothetical protein
MKKNVLLVLPVILTALISPAFAAERIVYPQAVVGPLGNQTFEIELFLGNRNDEDEWTGIIRLLQNSDLGGFGPVTFIDENGSEATVSNGERSISIPARGSRYFRIRSEILQIGVLAIETEESALDDLVSSFYYKLLDQTGVVLDVIGIEGLREAATGFRVMMTATGTSNVGIAMVAENALEQEVSEPVQEVPVTLIALLVDGTEATGTVTLGGENPGQRALFPFQVISGLPQGVRVAQLKVRSNEKLYVTTLALVAPPESIADQYGAAPALIDVDSPVTNLSVDTLDRQAVVDFFQTIYRASDGVEGGFTGDIGACDAGNTSAAFKNAILRRINYFRAMAGVSANVVLDDQLNLKSRKAALIMIAQGQLSHFPPSTWPCYTEEGREGAEKSNLHLAFGKPLGADIIDRYIMDSGDSNYAVGHRRWILYTRQRTMGTGSAEDSSSRSNALYVLGQRGSVLARNHSWPPSGYVPYQVVFPRWSFSSPDADFSQATVSMSQSGNPLSVSVLQIRDGYGDNTIVWEPSGIPSTAPLADTAYVITISNVLVSGVPTEFQYTVTMIDPDK